MMRVGSVFVLVWFIAALSLSITGWFERFSSAALFGIGAVVSATGFTVLHRSSEKFRGFLRVCSLRRLTMGQSLRFFGVLALFKADQNVLPALFAIPTAIIDIVFAASSFLVAARLVSGSGLAKPGFFAWHAAGLMGLGVSVTMAVLTSSDRFGLARNGITSQPMTWFPMSMVPVFIGPMVLIFHLLALGAAHPHYPLKTRAPEQP
jgi:hypothetical protein